MHCWGWGSSGGRPLSKTSERHVSAPNLLRGSTINGVPLLSDRQKVLVHHPDKQQQTSGDGEGDDHFKCIKIGELLSMGGRRLQCHASLPVAYDILSSEKRRRAFDSVDPTFDDAIPPNSAHSRDHFFTEFDAAFRENER